MSKTFLSAVLALTLSATTASADPYWYAIAPAEECKCDGFRTYTGWLTGVPEGQSSTEACYNTPATINNHVFSGADRCIKIGIQVGYFDVGDASCSSTGTDPSLWSCYQDPASTDPACQICQRKLNCDTGQIKRTC
ncbi:hypothetical protein [Cystobacter ferrugineus]|uniref:Secreted protein n=1 Tax=Cystobacter ferrugineus TaxID=83449 RepID=A0A1L9BJ81_9BACT|nr:hypothetical protein [Cystobacter ferrugineus]OJH42352.1 hypothetical protein BON30_03875 [Cystobacter ferrugineus]